MVIPYSYKGEYAIYIYIVLTNLFSLLLSIMLHIAVAVYMFLIDIYVLSRAELEIIF